MSKHSDARTGRIKKSVLVRVVLSSILFAVPVGAYAAAPVYVSSSTALGSFASLSGSATFNKPSGTTSSNLLIAAIVISDFLGGNHTSVTPPSNWILIRRNYNSFYDPELYVYYKIATVAEPSSYTFSISTQGSGVWGGGVSCISNVKISAPINGSAGATGGGAAQKFPSITTSVDNALVLALYGSSYSYNVYPVPSGLTERYRIKGTSDAITAIMDTFVQLTAGATGDKSVTASSAHDWVSQQVAIASKNDQTISFPVISSQVTTNILSLGATASSGLSVSYVVASGPAIISNSTYLTFSGTGTVVVVASQSGNGDWDPAANVTNTFAVVRATAQITLQALSQIYNGAARAVTAITTPPGLPVSITYNGSVVAPTNAGAYVITGIVNQAMYQAVQTGLLSVAKASQTISAVPVNDQLETNMVTLGGTATSGLPLAFSIGAGPATITAGTNLTFTGAGMVSVVASQGGDGNWSPAQNVTNTFRVYGVYSLQVLSPYGAFVPAGSTQVCVEGTSITNSVVGSPYDLDSVTRMVCTGWILIGNEPASGTGTTCVVVLTNNASLIWTWQTNLWLSVAARRHGLAGGSGWFPSGAITNITAIPVAGHQFTGWIGDVPMGHSQDNPLTLTMDRSRAVEATFLTSYYVAATGGDDVNSGLSMSVAKQSIQAALDETASGDTVIVSNGLYGAILVTNGVRVESVNGAEETTIEVMVAGMRGAYLGSNAVLSGFTVTGAVVDIKGAGVYAEPGAQINRCIIRGNTTSRDGGGVYGGSLTNCLLAGNSASNGAGAANASLTYCTVAGNTATDFAGGTKDCALLSSIVYGNLPDNHFGSTANFSCAEPLLSGTSNFTNDPYFADVLIGDYRLSYTSPCLSVASGGVNVDLEGTPRPQPKVYGGASGYDMGCYEYYPKAYFVWASGKGIPPYDSWANAATSIQAAVDNAAGGDLVMVEAGTYATFTLNKAVTLMSLRGTANTVVDGGGIARPITITAPAVLDGFTVQNGAADDCGGILADNGATIRNVLIINNTAIAPGGMGGGMCLYNGSSAERVMVVSNQAQYGAGVYAASTSTVSSSTIAWNTSGSGWGGGVYLEGGSVITESTISSNSSARGGGVYADSSQVTFCSVRSNAASEYGGGVALIGGALNNSLVEGNKSWNGGGIYALNAFSYSCIVASNFAASRGGGIYLAGTGLACNLTVANNQATTGGGGVWINGSSMLWNSIVMYNLASNVVAGSGDIRFCCIDPLMVGQGNISADPLLVSDDDYHLRALSPCIDAGTNLVWMTGVKDIDREIRVWPDWSDMGADEAVVSAGEIGKDAGIFVKWNVVVGAHLQIQTTTNLMDPMWADFGGVLTASQARMTMACTNDDPIGFFKMIWLKP
jgi:hypothetical protein